MDKWIEELGKGAIEFDPNHDEGDLFLERFAETTVSYKVNINPDKIWLTGKYTIQQLKALIQHMEKYQ